MAILPPFFSSSSSSLFHLSILFFFFAFIRIRPSNAFFFGSGGGCSCPVCPPPPPQSNCGCCNTNGNGGSFSGGCGGGGGNGGCANGIGNGGANCGCNGCAGGSGGCGGSGACDGTTAGGCGFAAPSFGCNGGHCGGSNGAETAQTGGGGGAVPCVGQSSSPCPTQQNCASANCAPNSAGCSIQPNGGNCAVPTAECDGSGSATEGNGCQPQQTAQAGNCGGPCPPPSSVLPSPPALSSNCQPIQICAPSHSCQPICAPASAPASVHPSPGAGGTYANGPAHPPPNLPPMMPPFASEPPVGGSPYESNSINNFASEPHPAESQHQQNVGSVDPSSFTTQQQPQIGPQPVAPLPVQPPQPAESDNQSDRDRESAADGIGGGYRDTGLNNGGKEGGLSLLSSKLIKIGGQTTTTTPKSTTMDWDFYEERLPDLADYETATNIASGGASVGTKSTVKAFVPTTTTTTRGTVGTSTSTGPTSAASFYTLSRTNSQRTATPIVWATAQGIGTTTEKPTGEKPTTTGTNGGTKTEKPNRTEEEKNDLLSDDYSENSFKKVHASVQNRNGQNRTPFGPAPSPNAPAAEEDPKCSSETLRAIMQENIVLSPTISKQLIFSAGRLAFGQSIDVICSKNKFSYTVVSSKVFCEASNGPVTCFAFLQP
ncbi:hypothetical protein niasHS_002726 [Heterodera schachtii]|uniref:Ground-like domain-containing protein n=1 Tax=Heterodera schachtii TaxID=97005 RepID=A0ABD2K293_HETSC